MYVRIKGESEETKGPKGGGRVKEQPRTKKVYYCKTKSNMMQKKYENIKNIKKYQKLTKNLCMVGT